MILSPWTSRTNLPGLRKYRRHRTPDENELLKALMHKHLPVEVWGQQYRDAFHTRRVNISNLRRRLETDAACPQIILTESGVGYRLKED